MPIYLYYLMEQRGSTIQGLFQDFKEMAIKEVGLMTFYPTSLRQGRRAAPLPHARYPGASPNRV
jgi:hypothetical protein